jgi:hypothetical protein
VRYYEINEDRNVPARVPALRCRNSKAVGCPARRIPEALGSLQSERGNSWPEAEGQAISRRWPRPCRLASSLESFRLRRSLLTGELIPGKALSNCLTNGKVESLCIGHVPAIIESKCLLIDITEQVKRFDAHVGAVQSALQKAPEVLHAVGVDVLAYVLFSVVDDLMYELLIKAPICHEFVSENVRAGGHVRVNLAMQCFLITVFDHGSLNFAAALEHSHHDGLTVWASSLNFLSPFCGVHVSRLASDEAFVDFNFSIEQPAALRLKAKADAREHEPCSLLTNPQIACNLVAADSVLAIREQPNSREPFIKAERGILENSPYFYRELALWMLDGALPYLAFRNVPRLTLAASWAGYDAIRPAPRYQVVKAIVGVGEIDNRIFEIGWFVAHKSILTGFMG